MCRGALHQGGRGLVSAIGSKGGSPEQDLRGWAALPLFVLSSGWVGCGSICKHQAPDLDLASDHPGTLADPFLSPRKAEKSSAALTSEYPLLPPPHPRVRICTHCDFCPPLPDPGEAETTVVVEGGRRPRQSTIKDLLSKLSSRWSTA